MEQKEKSLLLQDLSARLPYGVICNVKNDKINKDCVLNGIEMGGCTFQSRMALYGWNSFKIKPYLRPMSSMTEEESKRVTELLEPVDKYHYISPNNFSDVIDFFNSIHLDYRGLIEKNLALDCTGLHIYD